MKKHYCAGHVHITIFNCASVSLTFMIGSHKLIDHVITAFELNTVNSEDLWSKGGTVCSGHRF